MVKQVLEGNDAAFAALVERYKNYVFALIYPILNNRNDAEDAAQEAFIKLYRSLSGYSQGSFKSWLGRIAVNTAIDLKRKRERLGESLVESFPEKLLPRSQSAEEVMFGRGEDLEDLCRGLPDRYRQVVFEYYVQEKSCAEIAVEQGLALRTVESILYRSRKRIKEKLKEGRQGGGTLQR